MTISMTWGLFLLTALLGSAMASDDGCTHFIEPTTAHAIIIEPEIFDSLAPGDHICLIGGDYRQLFFRNIHGKEAEPVTIRNANERAVIHNEASFGIAFHNSSHIRLLGNGCDAKDSQFGIAITGTAGNGISIDQKSTNVEIAHVEVGHTGMSGIMAKTDPTCNDLSVVRDSFALYETILHNNYIHNTFNEGIYLGNSYYNGIILHCDGQDTLVYPHELIGVKVYDNILESTGKNSIQVSSAPEDCHIFNNRVTEDSQRAITYHMNGIQVGGGSRCEVYNNIVRDGKGSGINYFGQGPAKVYNNLIVNPGRTHHPDLPPHQFPVHGIYVMHIFNETSDPIHLFHNTLVNPKTDGVVFTNDQTEGNKIQNNIIINPGSFPYVGEKAFISLAEGVSAATKRNYLHRNAGEILFTDTLHGMYCLSQGSPAINAGVDLGDYGIAFDLIDNPRPFGDASDLGAYEYQFDDSDPGIDNTPYFSIQPNPAHSNITLRFKGCFAEKANIRMYNILGQSVMEHTRYIMDAEISLPVHDLKNGLYIIKVRNSSGTAAKPFIKQNN